MVAQEILDLLVWVRALVPEPFFYMAPWSRGQDVALSRRNHGFNSHWRCQIKTTPISNKDTGVFYLLCFFIYCGSSVPAAGKFQLPAAKQSPLSGTLPLFFLCQPCVHTAAAESGQINGHVIKSKFVEPFQYFCPGTGLGHQS